MCQTLMINILSTRATPVQRFSHSTLHSSYTMHFQSKEWAQSTNHSPRSYSPTTLPSKSGHMQSETYPIAYNQSRHNHWNIFHIYLSTGNRYYCSQNQQGNQKYSKNVKLKQTRITSRTCRKSQSPSRMSNGNASKQSRS